MAPQVMFINMAWTTVCPDNCVNGGLPTSRVVYSWKNGRSYGTGRRVQMVAHIVTARTCDAGGTALRPVTAIQPHALDCWQEWVP